MKLLDFAILALFFIVVGLGAFIAFLITNDVEVYEGMGTISQDTKGTISQSMGAEQFYPNIRFPDTEISYYLDPACDNKKQKNILTAFSIIASKTYLNFYPSPEGEEPRIKVLCSNFVPGTDEKGHFVAGEGGPSELINVSNYYVILESKISLYRADKCPTPQIALHELLHALGFNHSSDPKSVMYPVSSCDQEVDESILQEVNRLYSISSSPDLVIDSISASRVGNMLSFQANVSNKGFKIVQSANISVYNEGKFIRSFSLTEYPLPIGTTKILTVRNLKVPRDAGKFEFYVEMYLPSSEISLDNNRLEVALEREA